jgi:hypothetical protein
MSTIFCAPKGRAEKLGAIRQRASMLPVRAKGRASACCHLTLRCRQRAGAVSPPPRAPTPRDRQCNKCSPEIGSWFSETLLKSHGTLGARLGEALHVKASPCTLNGCNRSDPGPGGRPRWPVPGRPWKSRPRRSRPMRPDQCQRANHPPALTQCNFGPKGVRYGRSGMSAGQRYWQYGLLFR